MSKTTKFIHSFIHSGYFYDASSSSLRGVPDTAWILCQSFTLKRHRQLRVKDLPKVPTWWLERDSNPQPSGRQILTLPRPTSLHCSLPRFKVQKDHCPLCAKVVNMPSNISISKHK